MSPNTVDLAPAAVITLIGVVHHDPRSAAPLAALLETLQPDRLTVEISPELVAYRQTHGVLLKRKLAMILERLAGPAFPGDHPAIAAIQDLLGLPYEFSAARAYAEKRGVEIHAIDAGAASVEKLRHVEERLISLQHLKRIASSPREGANAARRYDLARQLLASPDAALRSDFLRGCRGEEGVGPRDCHLAGRIRALAQDCPGHLVHIGGWVHLMDDPGGETLYTLLRDSCPQRILLDPEHPLTL